MCHIIRGIKMRFRIEINHTFYYLQKCLTRAFQLLSLALKVSECGIPQKVCDNTDLLLLVMISVYALFIP
jgi:hypothetical protein